MLTTQCKLLAWTEVQTKLTNRQKEILKAFILRGRKTGERSATMHQIAEWMGVPLNTVSGRFSELKAKGWLKEHGVERPEGRRPRTSFVLYEWPVEIEKELEGFNGN